MRKTKKTKLNPLGQLEITSHGYFCSFQCAKAWGADHKNPKIQQQTSTLIYLLTRANYKHKKGVVAAPPRESLIMFGGDLTIEQFRTKSAVVPTRKRPRYKEARAKYKIKKVTTGFGFAIKTNGVKRRKLK